MGTISFLFYSWRDMTYNEYTLRHKYIKTKRTPNRRKRNREGNYASKRGVHPPERWCETVMIYREHVLS